MATIKSYTDLEQSRKLAEFLPLESADMYYYKNIFFGAISAFNGALMVKKDIELDETKMIPAWSLGALLELCPKGEYKDTWIGHGYYEGDKYRDKWCCSFELQEPFVAKTCTGDSPIDAAFDMVVWLKENKYI